MMLATRVLTSYIIALTVVLTTSESISTDSPKVYIPHQGEVLGSIDETSWTKQKFYSFRGIPYAESPSGKLRFQPPKSRASWNQTHDARNFGRTCPSWENISQLNGTQLKEDLEDCLSLNVYSKSLTTKQPVLVFIHGGRFQRGSANYRPNYLLEKDIVLVLVQYRLAALGFMSTFTKEIPGNVALMDVQLALKWVQQNIQVFGGDPSKVTIFGQSSGAAMTSALVISPKTSEDYFKKAIVQSSSLFAQWALNRTPLQQAEGICEALSCRKCYDKKKQNECLRNADTYELLKVAQVERFAPVIGDLYGILPDEPKTLIANFNRTIPLMIGFTKQDGRSNIMQNAYDTFVQQYGSISNVTVRQYANLLIETSKDNSGLTNNLLLRLFFKPNILDTNNHTAAWPAYFDITTDINIKSPVIAYANAIQRRTAPVYFYTFDYVGEHTSFNNDADYNPYPFEGGVHHSNDNIYLFNRYALNANDTEFAKKMVHLWYTFAVDGEPKSVDEPVLVIKPMESESGPYFHINNEITLGSDILKELSASVDDPENYKLINNQWKPV